jgi:hypothetical protein
MTGFLLVRSIAEWRKITARNFIRPGVLNGLSAVKDRFPALTKSEKNERQAIRR